MQSLDPQLPLFRVTTLGAEVSNTLSQPRFQATLLAGFAVIALLLASIGIYGVTSHAVSQRTQEVGIRMAMGAPRSTVRALMLRQHVTPGARRGRDRPGGRLRAQPVPVVAALRHQDGGPADLRRGDLALLAVAVAACWVPASRAMRVDPLVALRAE